MPKLLQHEKGCNHNAECERDIAHGNGTKGNWTNVAFDYLQGSCQGSKSAGDSCPAPKQVSGNRSFGEYGEGNANRNQKVAGKRDVACGNRIAKDWTCLTRLVLLEGQMAGSPKSKQHQCCQSDSNKHSFGPDLDGTTHRLVNRKPGYCQVPERRKYGTCRLRT